MLALLGCGAQKIWDLRNAEQDRQTVVESESNTVIMKKAWTGAGNCTSYKA